MGYGDPILDTPSTPLDGATHDTTGIIAQCGNSIFEYCKPQLVADIPSVQGYIRGTGGSTSYEPIARYMVPGEIIGTYTAATAIEETLHLDLRGWVTSGTGTFKLETDASTVTAGTITSTSRAWATGATSLFHAQADVAGADQEVTVQIKHSADNDRMYVESVDVYWDTSSTTLATGPYGADVLPLWNSVFETAMNPVTVAEMRKMIRMLDYLFRHRTPGIILNSWITEGTTDGNNTDVSGRCRAFQGEYVTQARFYVYLESGTGGGVTVTMDDGTVSVTEAGVREASFTGWVGHIDIALPPVRGVLGVVAPRMWEVVIRVTGDATVYGQSGWFMPIDSVTV